MFIIIPYNTKKSIFFTADKINMFNFARKYQKNEHFSLDWLCLRLIGTVCAGYGVSAVTVKTRTSTGKE
jgi:hypothetical protein